MTVQLRIKLKADHSATPRPQLTCLTCMIPILPHHTPPVSVTDLASFQEGDLSNWQYFKGAVNDASKEAIGYPYQMAK